VDVMLCMVEVAPPLSGLMGNTVPAPSGAALLHANH
jgi:hypothetical protein